MSLTSFITMYLAVVVLLGYLHRRNVRVQREDEPKTHLSRVGLGPAFVASQQRVCASPDEFRPQVGAWRARRIEFEY